MRVLVLSDIHANLTALEAVVEDAGRFDTVWFLGDAVGYGPDPGACVDAIAALEPEFWLAGNHDWAAIGKLDTTGFNPDARRAAQWTGEQLDEKARARLAAAPTVLTPEGRDVTLVHGSPRRPVWEYILDVGAAAENFAEFTTALCLVGHTHVPAIYEEAVDGALRVPVVPGQPVDLDATRRLVNPGSVGQPRDGDPRASYLLLDLDAGQATFHRVTYDVAAVQGRILDADLPPRLASRLDYGW